MAVSGNNNISPSDPNQYWSSLSSGASESVGLPKETPGAAGQAPAEGLGALMASGTDANYETELSFNKDKYKKTQEKASTSPKFKLRGAFSKIRASLQGFVSGFGTRASRVSARNAERSGEGTSMLPSDMEMVEKKGNRISPEMQRFYLDASGFTSSSLSLPDLSEQGVRSTSFVSPLASGRAASLPALFSSMSTFYAKHREVTPHVVHSWTEKRLGGEMISKLLDANVETASLLRRSSSILHEGMVDLSDLHNQDLSTAMQPYAASPQERKSLSSEKENKAEPQQPKVVDTSYSSSLLAKNEEKREENEDMMQEQMALARMMTSLLTTGDHSTYIPVNAQWSPSGTKFPAPKISGSIPKSYGEKGKHSRYHAQRSSSSHQDTESTVSFSSPSFSVHTQAYGEGAYRFPREVVSSGGSVAHYADIQQASYSTSMRGEEEGEVPAEYPPLHESIPKGLSHSYTVSSSYLFPSQQGTATLAPLSRSMDEYKRQVEKTKGPGAPPDPLIYQYRNVSVDPPLVLRSPQPFLSSSRFVIQGKPEASAVRDDGRGNGGFSQQQQSEERGGSSKKSRKNKNTDVGE